MSTKIDQASSHDRCTNTSPTTTFWLALALKWCAGYLTQTMIVVGHTKMYACRQQVVGGLQREAADSAGVAAQPVVLEAAAVGAQLLLLGAVVHLPPLRLPAARHLLPPLRVVPLPQTACGRQWGDGSHVRLHIPWCSF